MTDTEFSQDQFSSVYPKGIEQHYWNRARNCIINDFIEENKLQEKRMLEIGCGRGVVLQALRTSGFDCYGVELAPVSIEKDLVGYLFSGIDFGKLPQQLIDSVEVVFLFDVIEHIEDEKEILSRIRHTFPRLTHVVVTVPARKELWSNYDIHYGHFRRYSIESLETAIHRSDFVSLRSSYVFHALYLPARLLAYCGAKRNVVVVPPGGVMRIVHRIIGWLFYIEYRVVPCYVLGTSIISVLTPNIKNDVCV